MAIHPLLAVVLAFLLIQIGFAGQPCGVRAQDPGGVPAGTPDKPAASIPGKPAPPAVANFSSFKIYPLSDSDMERIAQLRSVEGVNLDNRQVTDAQLAQLLAMPPLKRLATLSLRNNRLSSRGVAALAAFTNLRRLELGSSPRFSRKLDEVTVAALTRLEHLEHLGLNGFVLEPSGVAALRSLKRLRELRVGQAIIDERGLRAIAELRELEKLELPAAVTGSLLVLKPLGKLSSLAVASFPEPPPEARLVTAADVLELVTDAQGRPLADGLRCVGGEVATDGQGRLTGLKLAPLRERPQMTNAVISWINRCTHLESLSLHGGVDVAGLATLELPGLKHLDIRQVGGEGEVLRAVERLPHLESLAVPEQTGDKDLAALRVLSRLEVLNLSGSRVRGAGLKHLPAPEKLLELQAAGSDWADAHGEQLRRFTSLRRLDLSGTRISDRVLSSLGGLVQLESLRLAEVAGVTKAGLQELGALRQLVELDLWRTGVAPADRLGFFRDVLQLPPGRIAELEGRVTRDDAGKIVAAVFPRRVPISDGVVQILGQLDGLEQLRFYYQPVTAAAFSERFPALRRVVLYRCEQFDDEALRQLVRHADLYQLSLVGSKRVTDGAVAALATAKHLKRLHLRQTAITAEGIARLRAALPECEIKE